MDVTHYVEQAARAAWAEEIERAIRNAKRTPEDKAFRREWYRAGGDEGEGGGYEKRRSDLAEVPEVLMRVHDGQHGAPAFRPLLCLGGGAERATRERTALHGLMSAQDVIDTNPWVASPDMRRRKRRRAASGRG
jgi:hypothetical protein